jgi:hypothetical protein
MKKMLISSLAIFTSFAAMADDLTALVSDTDPGLSTGAVDLTVSGGVAPFTYSWTGPGGFSSTSEDISGLEYGTYTVTVTDVYCGVATLDILVDSLNPSNGIVPEKEPEISIYPNPTDGIVYLKSDTPLDVEVYNIAGEMIIRKVGVSLVDLTNLSSGIYMLRIRTESTSVTRRIVKR